MDRTDGHGAAPKRYRPENGAQCAEGGGSAYGVVQKRSKTPNHQEECRPGSRDGEPRPRAKPHHVLASPVVFRGRRDAYAAKQAATYLQVPTVVIAASTHDCATGPQHRFQWQEYLGAIEPFFTPELKHPRPWEGESWKTADSPGREGVDQTAPQASKRLHQVKQSRENAQAKASKAAFCRRRKADFQRRTYCRDHRKHKGGYCYW